MSDYRDDRFEWDLAKSARCFREKGFDFAFASLLFESDFYYEEIDDRGHEEERNKCVGIIDTKFFTVVYTTRRSRKRIISAWQSDDEEVKKYITFCGQPTAEEPR